MPLKIQKIRNIINLSITKRKGKIDYAKINFYGTFIELLYNWP